MRSKSPLKTRDDLSMAYTPGVARVCPAIADDRDAAWNLTIKQNTVAVVSDGTAVLGLGDIGPEAAMPVMEGKAMLFKEFGGVDAWPICLATKDVDEIVSAVQAIAPGFGGINLEDISAPRCFEIERRLRDELDIPVFHDDQHGTAIVVLAALTERAAVVGKRIEDVKIVITGVGAAGIAVTDILLAGGRAHDRRLRPARAPSTAAARPGRGQGRVRGADEPARRSRAAPTRCSRAPTSSSGSRARARSPPAGVARMADDAIVFAMANPTPEIAPEELPPGKRRRRRDRPLRLPEPDQQRARLPRCLPRRPRRARPHDHRGDEGGRRPGDRRGDPPDELGPST